MRIWAPGEQEGVFQLEEARAWRRSGLITGEQAAAIEAAIGPLPSSAGWAVRLLFFGLAFTASSAVTGLLTILLKDKSAQVVFLFGAAAASYLLAETLIRRQRLYRFGVEEGLLLGALFQFSCALLLIQEGRVWPSTDTARILEISAALYLSWLYLRFGYLYSAFGAVAALALALGSRVGDWGEIWVRCIFAGYFSALLAGSALRRPVPDADKSGWRTLQAFLFLLIPLTLNMRAEGLARLDFAGHRGGGWFYWATFAAVLLLPAAGLFAALTRRHRPLLAAGAIAALAGLASIKPYLGIPRHSWDPAALGIFLMALSLLVRRWLNSGGAGERDGFTAKPLIAERGDRPDIAGLVAAAAAASPSAPAPEHKGFSGGGGSSGGAGAGGAF